MVQTEVFLLFWKGEGEDLKTKTLKVITELLKFSMFGNLDDVAECRSMVSVMVTTTADILSLKTVKMYEIVKNYKWTYSRLKKYVIIENMVTLKF